MQIITIIETKCCYCTLQRTAMSCCLVLILSVCVNCSVAREMFLAEPRTDVRRVLVLVTDGVSDNPESMWQEAMRARAESIDIFAVSWLSPSSLDALRLLRNFPNLLAHNLDPVLHTKYSSHTTL